MSFVVQQQPQTYTQQDYQQQQQAYYGGASGGTGCQGDQQNQQQGTSSAGMRSSPFRGGHGGGAVWQGSEIEEVYSEGAQRPLIVQPPTLPASTGSIGTDYGMNQGSFFNFQPSASSPSLPGVQYGQSVNFGVYAPVGHHGFGSPWDMSYSPMKGGKGGTLHIPAPTVDFPTMNYGQPVMPTPWRTLGVHLEGCPRGCQPPDFPGSAAPSNRKIIAGTGDNPSVPARKTTSTMMTSPTGDADWADLKGTYTGEGRSSYSPSSIFSGAVRWSGPRRMHAFLDAPGPELVDLEPIQDSHLDARAAKPYCMIYTSDSSETGSSVDEFSSEDEMPCLSIESAKRQPVSASSGRLAKSIDADEAYTRIQGSASDLFFHPTCDDGTFQKASAEEWLRGGSLSLATKLESSGTSSNSAFDYDSGGSDPSLNLPSIGSKWHAWGLCTPCAFFHGYRACKFGALCTFCHSYHSRKSRQKPSSRKRKSAKKRLSVMIEEEH